MDSRYLHHLRHPHSYESRALRLTHEWEDWGPQIRHTWADLIEPWEFEVYVVTPNLPIIYQGIVGTVLIVQSLHPDKTAGLLTAVLRANPITDIIATAHSLDVMETQDNIIHYAQVDRQCAVLQPGGLPAWLEVLLLMERDLPVLLPRLRLRTACLRL